MHMIQILVCICVSWDGGSTQHLAVPPLAKATALGTG